MCLLPGDRRNVKPYKTRWKCHDKDKRPTGKKTELLNGKTMKKAIKKSKWQYLALSYGQPCSRDCVTVICFNNTLLQIALATSWLTGVIIVGWAQAPGRGNGRDLPNYHNIHNYSIFLFIKFDDNKNNNNNNNNNSWATIFLLLQLASNPGRLG